jgi:hypothetical protein
MSRRLCDFGTLKDIYTPPAQLTAEISERQQVVSPEQHMNGLSPVGDRFDDIQLVR